MLCKIRLLGKHVTDEKKLYEAVVATHGDHEMAVIGIYGGTGASYFYNKNHGEPEFTVIEIYGSPIKTEPGMVVENIRKGRIVRVEKTTITGLGEKKITESTITTYGD